MNNTEIINKIIEFVKAELGNNDSAHDWWHIYRVWNLSKYKGFNLYIFLF